MIERDDIITALSGLGEIISSFLNGENNPEIEKAIDCSCADNYWFTKENVRRALDAIASKMLDNKKLRDWVTPYPFNRSNSGKIGLIMAGNIPAVGFHDFLSILLSGNIAVIKPSSKDKYLIKTICRILTDKFPALSGRIIFTEAKPQNINAIIATGSNNSSRYFRAEYKDIPSLVRKNRYSLSILEGNETPSETEALGDDIFSYFGLGCRNVSNIFVPRNYDWNLFFDSMKKYSDISNHQGYSDCFRYQKAISELSGENYLTNGFVIIRKNILTFSSIAAINYTEYENIEQVKTFVTGQKDRIQCVVSKTAYIENSIPFGQTQKPELTDYADDIDTMNFIAERCGKL
ncbi:MAG: hypothetical protein LBT50_05275 [Prevotellaceae bacterium]|jgi:hypothetical protein|nr:hypothetical protein [Prevotellaceae bacterium]